MLEGEEEVEEARPLIVASAPLNLWALLGRYVPCSVSALSSTSTDLLREAAHVVGVPPPQLNAKASVDKAEALATANKALDRLKARISENKRSSKKYLKEAAALRKSGRNKEAALKFRLSKQKTQIAASLEKQRDSVRVSMEVIETQENNHMVIGALKNLQAAMQGLQQKVTVEEVTRTTAELEVNIEEANEVNEALSQPLAPSSVNAEDGDDENLAELDEYLSSKTTSSKSRYPDLPNDEPVPAAASALPTHPGGSSSKRSTINMLMEETN
jgi:hypothetical protein